MKFVFLIIAALCAALSGCGGNNPLSAVNAQAQAAALTADSGLFPPQPLKTAHSATIIKNTNFIWLAPVDELV